MSTIQIGVRQAFCRLKKAECQAVTVNLRSRQHACYCYRCSESFTEPSLLLSPAPLIVCPFAPRSFQSSLSFFYCLNSYFSSFFGTIGLSELLDFALNYSPTTGGIPVPTNPLHAIGPSLQAVHIRSLCRGSDSPKHAATPASHAWTNQMEKGCSVLRLFVSSGE